MNLKQPKNANYCAIVVEIKTIVPLANCDNVQGAIILGNQVVVGKDTEIGTKGLYFPVECQLSKEFLSVNNLYRQKLGLNADSESKGGYFEENRRIRCQKFRGIHNSEGFFIPIDSISFTGVIPSELNIGDEFDELNGIEICRKYIPKNTRTPGMPGTKKDKNLRKYESKLVDNQFRFHQDTSMLFRNLHRIKPTDLISITYKIHGTSFISSKIVCKKQLTIFEKILKRLGVNIVDTVYDYIYSSRKVIKNEELNVNAAHFYGQDIWGIAHSEVKDFLQDGMTIYGEIAGFLPNGGYIQKDYDYGCDPSKCEHKLFIYRITYTNTDGKVFEFSAKQVQQWCHKNGLTPVPELFYGYASELSDERLTEENWRNKFLENIKMKYNEKKCFLCNNDVFEEGAVIRIENLDFEAFKCKSNNFYEYETKQLDKGETNIEDEA